MIGDKDPRVLLCLVTPYDSLSVRAKIFCLFMELHYWQLGRLSEISLVRLEKRLPTLPRLSDGLQPYPNAAHSQLFMKGKDVCLDWRVFGPGLRTQNPSCTCDSFRASYQAHRTYLTHVGMRNTVSDYV